MKTSSRIVLLSLLIAPQLCAAGPAHQSKHLAVSLAPNQPAFSFFSVDSLGQGKVQQNPALLPTNAALPGLKKTDAFTYTLNDQPLWRVKCGEKTLTLVSDFVVGAPPFVLKIDQKANHATLLGLMQPGERRMALPCVLHLPDMGSLRITGGAPGAKLDYDARRRLQPGPFVLIEFPPATAGQKHVEYKLEVAAIHPALPGIKNNPLYDGFRRDFLNIFQVNRKCQTWT